jgi:uncharacterized membrane protein
MGVAMTPVLELRGAIPFGLALGLPLELAFLVSVIGNMIPVPAIILFIRQIFRWLRKHPWWDKVITSLETKAHLKGRMVRKYRVLGLILLVAVPLPGTGAWTGARVASLLDLRMRQALPAILVGVLIAGCLVTAAASGILALF